MRRIALAMLAGAMISGCGTGTMPPLTADCRGKGEGDPNNRNPVVCVSVYGDPSGFGGLLVNPMVVHATRRQPVVLKWQTRNAGEDISVRMKDENCTAQNSCRGQGTCTIPIKPNPAGGEVCRYELTVRLASGHVLTLDPIVKIDTD